SANIKHIIQGQADYPLTALGIAQAEAAARFFETVELNAVYSSDLQRASHTAEVLSTNHCQEPQLTEDLREVFLGPLEKRPRADIMKEYPEIASAGIAASGIEGTEPFARLTERCARLISHWKEHHKDEAVLAVSHGGFIGILLMYLIAGEDWHQWKKPFIIGNTGISKIIINEQEDPEFHFINSTGHLQKLK
ncbi:MAG: histidine phosphatase family protein, partial [Alkalicoccus sp.]